MQSGYYATQGFGRVNIVLAWRQVSVSTDLPKPLVDDYAVQRLTVAILVLNVFIPAVFSQTVEQRKAGASPSCVEIIKRWHDDVREVQQRRPSDQYGG